MQWGLIGLEENAILLRNSFFTAIIYGFSPHQKGV